MESNGFWQKILRKRIPVFYIIILIIVFLIASCFIISYFNHYYAMEANMHSKRRTTILRLKDYRFVKPIVLGDAIKESEDLQDLKADLNTFIENKKKSGDIISASVFLRKFDTGDWINVNDKEGFSPGSLMKIPILITYLRGGENNSQVLNDSILFEKNPDKFISSEFSKDVITPGKKYAVRELLYNMIVNSDNNATMLLIKNIDLNIFRKLFTDLGLPEPQPNDINFRLTASDFSRFVRVLYNSTYLNADNSEYALSLMAESNFKDGILKGMPSTVKTVHKFGEQTTAEGHEFHETAIVYINNNAYIVTIMTKGKDIKKLPPVIAEISKHIYNSLLTNL